jgi:serine/threonine-protein kinase
MHTVLAGRYRMGPVIGRGGMGEVRAATDTALDRPVAVKLMRADLADDPNLRRRFEREARAAARVSHPNVIAIFDVGEDDGVPFIVMERLPGRTLADELARGALAEPRVCAVATEMLDALAAAHDLGVVHRDIKPGNVLLRDDGRIAIADFGIAKVADDAAHTTTGMTFGTGRYLAPERLLGDPATPASDVYSVGVVMFEALTGRPAFEATAPLALAHAVASETPQFTDVDADHLDPRLRAVVDRALAKDPEHRFASAREMCDALTGRSAPHAAPTLPVRTAADPTRRTAPRTERLPAPDRAQPTPTATPTPIRATHARRRWVLAVAAVLVAAGVTAGVVVASDDGGSSNPATTATTIAPNPSIPAPLRNAIDGLDRAVDR